MGEVPTGDLARLARLIAAGDLSATGVVQASLDRIEAADPTLNAFVCVDPRAALEQAERVDREVAAGRDVGPLGGIPFGVKDLDDAIGLPTRHGSRWYADA